jgi:hypothetical protein
VTAVGASTTEYGTVLRILGTYALAFKKEATIVSERMPERVASPEVVSQWKQPNHYLL